MSKDKTITLHTQVIQSGVEDGQQITMVNITNQNGLAYGMVTLKTKVGFKEAHNKFENLVKQLFK